MTALAGEVAVVTGAAGRLGSAFVDALQAAGATVAAVDRVARPDREIRLADVTDRAALEAVADDLGPVSVLVNAAGIDAPPGTPSAPSLDAVALDAFRETVDVNLTGTFVACQVFGTRMAAAGRGSIVNIGSLYAGVAPDPGFYDHYETPFLKPPAYAASKAGVLGLTRYLARLWGPQGVRVNTLSPGGVRDRQDATFVAKYEARVALGRMAELDDLVGPLLFLASDASRYVTGQELRADGGFTA